MEGCEVEGCVEKTGMWEVKDCEVMEVVVGRLRWTVERGTCRYGVEYYRGGGCVEEVARLIDG